MRGRTLGLACAVATLTALATAESDRYDVGFAPGAEFALGPYLENYYYSENHDFGYSFFGAKMNHPFINPKGWEFSPSVGIGDFAP